MSADTQKPSGSRADATFAALAARFLDEYLRRDPVAATTAGEHRYDDRWADMSEEGEAEWLRFYDRVATELAAIPRDALSEPNRVDAAILENQIHYGTFAIRELREPETSPLHYTTVLGEGLDPLIMRTFAPIGERMASLRGRLEGIAAVLDVAKRRLRNPPRVHTETALEQTRGLVALCERGLRAHFAEVPDQRAALETAANHAAAALHAFATYLEKEVLPKSTGEFRLGPDRFRRKLQLVLDADIDPVRLVDDARALLGQTQNEMVDTATELWPTLFPGRPAPAHETLDEKRALVRAVLDAIAEDRSNDHTIVGDAKRLLSDTTQFVREHDLVRLPPDPCDVIEMPEYRRGVAIAYCDASGPLEKKRETYFAIAPTPHGWPAPRVTSFYREYNRSMLANLTVHEAMPGHFLQLMHAASYKSDVRAVFASGAFIEGWAVYAEWLMAQHGFGGPKVRLMRQKMILRSCANAILDHGVHAGAMDEAAARALLERDAFQEEGEAVGKWRRAQLTSAQLTTYYYGFTEMMKLRRAAEGLAGFDERRYHDTLLSFGSPPLRHVARLLDVARSASPDATRTTAP